MESRSSEEAEWIIPTLAEKHRTQTDQVLRDADIPGTIIEACEKDRAPIPEVYYICKHDSVYVQTGIVRLTFDGKHA